MDKKDIILSILKGTKRKLRAKDISKYCNKLTSKEVAGHLQQMEVSFKKNEEGVKVYYIKR